MQELVDDTNFQRTRKRRLSEFRAQGPRDELVIYSEVVHPSGGMRQTGRHYSYFYFYQGRELLLEDQYCPNPECDCREVVVEFWERTRHTHSENRIDVRQLLAAAIGFDGKLHRIEYIRADPGWASDFLRTWLSECRYQLDEFRRRYPQIKEVGRRSFPAPLPVEPPLIECAQVVPAPTPSPIEHSRSGRNDPCPCGSGLKFKRCCWRRFAAS